MCYRIELTARPPTDPLIATAKIGILSNLELWLGIIVACLPTMRPFIRAHVSPSLSKLSQKLYGSSNLSTKEGTVEVQLRTFGGSGPPSSKNRSNYTEISEVEVPSKQINADKQHLVPPSEMSKVQTDREFSNTKRATGSGGIYVQKQFATYDV